MFPSMEVRWFFEHRVPPEVLEWFRQGEREPKEQPPREDYYLRLTDSDSLGIKLREGRIEVKQRHHEYGLVRFHERAAGRVEHWRKWSFKLAEADTNLSNISVPAWSWIGVKKERKLRKYQVGSDRQVFAVSADDYPEQGCNLELTNIAVEGKAWWSLGFEAFGDESSIQDNLLLVVKYVLTGDELPVLEAKDSYGYPKWLGLIL